jgi:hypothetical protein
VGLACAWVSVDIMNNKVGKIDFLSQISKFFPKQSLD